MRRHNARLLRTDDAPALRRELARLGAEPTGQARASWRPVRVDHLPLDDTPAVAEALRREGGELLAGPAPGEGALLCADEAALRRAARALHSGGGAVARLAEEVLAALDAVASAPPPTTIRSTTFAWGRRTYVMGILNVTPDSFSGDGLLLAGDGKPGAATTLAEAAAARAKEILEEGADILDVGGESTRPGAPAVDAETEAARVVPAIRRIRDLTDAPISVDTYKASVARAALEAGADAINDVWGLRMDPAMAHLAAERGVPVVIMHNRSRPRDAAQEERLGGRYVGVDYDDLVADVLRELTEQIEYALAAGVELGRIIVDPGIGFGKTVSQNLYLLNHLDALRVLGRPILLGSSRKSFIGYTLDLPPDARVEGTAATVALGIARGADMVRVHDVREMARVARMTDAILRAQVP